MSTCNKKHKEQRGATARLEWTTQVRQREGSTWLMKDRQDAKIDSLL